MGDKIDILKIILDFLKGNKVLFLLVSTALAGGAAGHFIPPLVTAKPVEVKITVPDNAELKAEIKRLNKKIKKLQKWHGGS